MPLHTSYHSRLLEASRLKTCVEDAVSTLTAPGRRELFDAIAVTGTSGCIFGGALSLALGKPLILVRKESDQNHSRLAVECDSDHTTYIFVDDLICSGDTRRYVVRTVKRVMPRMECTGQYVYNVNLFTLFEANFVERIIKGSD